MFIIACILILIGIFTIVRPNIIWHISHFLYIENGEPSEFALILIRLGGLLFLFAGLGEILFGLLTSIVSV